MTITFVSNFINHHQIGVAEEIYSLTNGNFRFLETIPMPESFKKNGYPDFSRMPFVVRMWEDSRQEQEGNLLILNSDVVVCGGILSVRKLIRKRANKGLLTLIMGERWLKRGLKNVFSPNIFAEYVAYWIGGWSKKPVYRLCMSAYAANDVYSLYQYKGKCFKWGYFTKVDCRYEIEATNQRESTSESIPLMWCARFLRWKHPELPVRLAARLKAKGYNFVLDMFGSGEELENTKALIEKLGVGDCVILCGNRPNDGILKEMSQHKVFLFTSDRNEGWGAVLNEAMANGCVPVAADAIGSVPFLVEDGENGMIFKSEDIDSLEEKVTALLQNKQLLSQMSEKAKKTMWLWSPKEAANRLVKLIEAIQDGKENPFKNGPCSKAEPIR